MSNTPAGSLTAKILALHDTLTAARVPHAFGGALALAWCTQRARGTVDVDVNVFIDPDDTPRLLDALPAQVAHTDNDRVLLERDGQARLWWDTTPIDVFLDTTDFHRQAATRTRTEPFAGTDVPFLGCGDLAVFKAFFNRTKDWADLEEMHAAGTLDVDAVTAVLAHYLGADDHRNKRLRDLASGDDR